MAVKTCQNRQSLFPTSPNNSLQSPGISPVPSLMPFPAAGSWMGMFGAGWEGLVCSVSWLRAHSPLLSLAQQAELQALFPGAGLTLLSPEFLWALSGTVSSGIAGEEGRWRTGLCPCRGREKIVHSNVCLCWINRGYLIGRSYFSDWNFLW